MKDRIDLQSDEFKAVDRLAKEWRRLQMTPIVDDDYPEMRHYYESALRNALRAIAINRDLKIEGMVL